MLRLGWSCHLAPAQGPPRFIRALHYRYAFTTPEQA
eukprot:COSAG01_NODE_70297_length_259_cov_0.600000_1_plen_35_part_10